MDKADFREYIKERNEENRIVHCQKNKTVAIDLKKKSYIEKIKLRIRLFF